MRRLRYWFSEWGNSHLQTDAEKRANKLSNFAYLGFVVYVFLASLAVLVVHLVWPAGQVNENALIDAQVSLILLGAFLPVGILVAALLWLKNGLGFFAPVNTVTHLLVLVWSGGMSVVFGTKSHFQLLAAASVLLPVGLWLNQPRWLTITQIVASGVAFVVFGVVAGAGQWAIPPLVEMAHAVTASAFLLIAVTYYCFHFLHRAVAMQRLYTTEHQLRERLLTDIIPAMEQSEKRYSHLVESSPDIVFSLNENFEFKMINKTVKKLLHYDPASLLGKHCEVIVATVGQDNLEKQLLMSNLEAVLTNKETAEFKLNLKDKYIPEPITMHLALSYAESEGHREILGKISPLTEDKLNSFLRTERSAYLIDNTLLNAEMLSMQLTRNLSMRLSKPDLLAVRVALREMLVNAIEHGNLNISFDEKTQAQLEGRYLEFMRERQNEPQYADKRVMVEYVLKPGLVAFRISDEGPGFDHAGFLQRDQAVLNEEAIQHGRGIFMSLNVFDKVRYFGRGNRVVMAKRLIVQDVV